MPLYDFRCRRCGHEFEALVRSGEASPTCPECQSSELERLLSLFAVSSEDRRDAAVKKERKRQVAGRKDALVAEEEYRQKHEGH